MEEKIYSKKFYENQEKSSLQSAKEVVPIILRLINPKSVVDVGCGIGTWLSVFKEKGVENLEATYKAIRGSGNFYLDGTDGLSYWVKFPNGKSQQVMAYDPITKQPTPLKINFLDGDGKTNWIKKNEKTNYELSFEDMNFFILQRDAFSESLTQTP